MKKTRTLTLYFILFWDLSTFFYIKMERGQWIIEEKEETQTCVSQMSTTAQHVCSKCTTQQLWNRYIFTKTNSEASTAKVWKYTIWSVVFSYFMHIPSLKKLIKNICVHMIRMGRAQNYSKLWIVICNYWTLYCLLYQAHKKKCEA